MGILTLYYWVILPHPPDHDVGHCFEYVFLSSSFFHLDRALLFGLHNLYLGIFCHFFLIAAANTPCVDLEVDGSTISQIINAWSKYMNPYSFHDWYNWALRVTDTEHVVVEDVWIFPYWIPWEPMLHLIAELNWEYSWIDRFAHSATSVSILLGQFL